MSLMGEERRPREGLVCAGRLAALYLPLTLLLGAGLLLFHRIPEGYDRPYCAENWTLTSRVTIVLNCDSPEYLHLASEPQDLLLPTSSRQSRPGLVLLAALLSHLLPSSQSLSGLLAKVAGHPLDDFTLELFSTYLPYLALNLAFVWISLVLFASLTGCRRGQSLAVLLAGALLLFNDVVKAFLFSPNTALLAIVAPLLALWCYMAVRNRRWDGYGRLALLGAVVGLAVITYQLFIVALPMTWLALWLRAREHRNAGRWRHLALEGGIVTLIGLLPAVLWYVWVRFHTGQFYFLEVAQYSDVIWLWAGLRVAPGPTLAHLGDNAIRIGVSAIRQAIPAVVLILLVILLTLRSRLPQETQRNAGYLGPLVVSFLCVAFFAVVGLVENRVAYSAVPPVVVAVGMAVDGATSYGARRERLVLTVGTAIVVLAQALLMLAKVGPFS